MLHACPLTTLGLLQVPEGVVVALLLLQVLVYVLSAAIMVTLGVRGIRNRPVLCGAFGPGLAPPQDSRAFAALDEAMLGVGEGGENEGGGADDDGEGQEEEQEEEEGAAVVPGPWWQKVLRGVLAAYHRFSPPSSLPSSAPEGTTSAAGSAAGGEAATGAAPPHPGDNDENTIVVEAADSGIQLRRRGDGLDDPKIVVVEAPQASAAEASKPQEEADHAADARKGSATAGVALLQAAGTAGAAAAHAKGVVAKRAADAKARVKVVHDSGSALLGVRGKRRARKRIPVMMEALKARRERVRGRMSQAALRAAEQDPLLAILDDPNVDQDPESFMWKSAKEIHTPHSPSSSSSSSSSDDSDWEGLIRAVRTLQYSSLVGCPLLCGVLLLMLCYRLCFRCLLVFSKQRLHAWRVWTMVRR